MNLNDYASDIGKTVEEVMSLCDSLGIEYKDAETILSDDDIIMLDNNLPPDDGDEVTEVSEEQLIEEEQEDIAEELAKNTKIDLDNSQKFEKVKKKQVNKENKTNFLKE